MKGSMTSDRKIMLLSRQDRLLTSTQRRELRLRPRPLASVPQRG